MLVRMMHCGCWQKPTEVYYLLPDKDLKGQPKKQIKNQVIQILKCQLCAKNFYQVYTLFKNQSKSNPIKISQKKFDSKWQFKILNDQDSSQLGSKTKIFSSDFSKQVAQPADLAIYYLKKNGHSL